jgi:hypothetical protein
MSERSCREARVFAKPGRVMRRSSTCGHFRVAFLARGPRARSSSRVLAAIRAIRSPSSLSIFMTESDPMQNNRPSRSMQQVRTLLQTMGRSIDEARNRRLGPEAASDTAPVALSEATPNGAPAAKNPAPAPVASTSARAQPAAPTSTPAPPVRGANEMFTDGTPRLKARPKRAK